MRTIEKRADQLQPGDILVGSDLSDRRVVVMTLEAAGRVGIYSQAIGKIPAVGFAPPPPPVPQPGGKMFCVEAPELLPAEIDALVGAARQLPAPCPSCGEMMEPQMTSGGYAPPGFTAEFDHYWCAPCVEAFDFDEAPPPQP